MTLATGRPEGSLRAFLPGPEPLYFASYFKGQRFASEWTVRRDDSPDELETLLELDPRVVGSGGNLVRMRSQLRCDDDLGPLRVCITTRGARFVFTVGAGTIRIELPDHSVLEVPRGDAGFLVQAELTMPWALLLWRLAGQQRLATPTRLVLFDASSLQPSPCALEPALDLGAGWYRSSHQQELELDASGLLVTMRVAKSAVEVRRETAPPLPSWHDDVVLAVPEPLRYEVPAHASFTLREVSIAGPVTPLGGSLTVPAGQPPFPAVLFLAGSGRHNRHGFAGDIDLGSHEVVDALAEAGFVGLRYDTRGTGKTQVGHDLLEQGFKTVIADARAALDYLAALPEVDPARLCLLGHSQGGVVALALAQTPEHGVQPACCVALLAPPGRDMGDVLIDQVESESRRLGLPEAAAARQAAEIRQFVQLVRDGTPWVAGQVPDHMVAAEPTRRWLLDHLGFSSLDLITRVPVPILIVHGEKDFQVTADKDAEPLRAAGQGAGRDVTLLRLPGLDHLFKPIDGESTLATYFEPNRHVAPAMLAALTAWLREHTQV